MKKFKYDLTDEEDIEKLFFDTAKIFGIIFVILLIWSGFELLYFDKVNNYTKELVLTADKKYENRINEVLELVGLSHAKNKKVSNYSLGMKQRLAIARAFLNNPKIVILDEPTNGLDPQGVIEIRNLIRYLAKTENVTFIVCSHILSEVQNLCNRISIINNGEVLVEGNTEELIRKSNCKCLEEYYLRVLGLEDKYA